MRSEDALQAEIAARLRIAPLAAIWVAVPNGLWIPARTDAERRLVARIISQMKNGGMLTPGAADLLFLWDSGSGAIELKRPASQSLFGKRPAGRPSGVQKDWAARAVAAGVRHAYCTSWSETRDTLIGWGRLPEGWGCRPARSSL